MLMKQLCFDLTNYRLNKLKYIMYIVLFLMYGMMIFAGFNNNNAFLMISCFLSSMIIFIYHLCISSNFENNLCNFTINKLIYYPTTKITILISRIILYVIIGILMITGGIVCYVIGCKFGNVEVNYSVLSEYIKTIGISIVAFYVMSFGLRTFRAMVIMSCIHIPCLFILLADHTFVNRTNNNLIIIGVVFIIDIIINSIFYYCINKSI